MVFLQTVDDYTQDSRLATSQHFTCSLRNYKGLDETGATPQLVPFFQANNCYVFPHILSDAELGGNMPPACSLRMETVEFFENAISSK